MSKLRICWAEHGDIVIRDIHEKWHDRVANHMLEHHFKQNHIFEALRMNEDEEPGIHAEYLKCLKHLLRNECSIVAMDETTQAIYAVAIVKWMTKEWRSWTQLPLSQNSHKLAQLITLNRSLVFQYEQENPEHIFDSLHLMEYWISEELREDELFMEKFFFSIFEVGRHMKMPRVTFTSLYCEQQLEAEKAGFEQISYAIYAMYVDRLRRRPFSILREIGEQNVVLYEKMLEPLVPYNEMGVTKPLEEEVIAEVIVVPEKHEEHKEEEEEAD